MIKSDYRDRFQAQWAPVCAQIQFFGTLSSNGDQFHPFACDKVQRFVDISNLVETHLPSVWLG